jgi:TetR/AcrR family transcriptional repressor of mexJK operon
MPRVAGQIDVSKNEAILDAAMEVLGERGVSVSMDEIARRAGVSKQTVYNHYGSKAELVRAMAERRVHEITAPLATADAVDNPAEALAGYARVLLNVALGPRNSAMFRTAMLHAADMPDVARAMWEAGPKASRSRLAEYLTLETRAGRLFCPNPAEAAEFFGGMVIGTYQTAELLGVGVHLDDARIDRIATEATARFLRAYAA